MVAGVRILLIGAPILTPQMKLLPKKSQTRLLCTAPIRPPALDAHIVYRHRPIVKTNRSFNSLTLDIKWQVGYTTKQVNTRNLLKVNYNLLSVFIRLFTILPPFADNCTFQQVGDVPFGKRNHLNTAG